MTLSPKRARFVEEYLVDLNGAQAVLRAGYKTTAPAVQASKLLAMPAVADAVAAAKAERSERTKIDADYVLKQAVKLHERCMQEITPFTDRKGDHIHDENGNPLYVFNATGAARALEMVGKHVDVQAFREQHGHSGPDGGPIQTEEVSARDKLAGKLASLAAGGAESGDTGEPD